MIVVGYSGKFVRIIHAFVCYLTLLEYVCILSVGSQLNKLTINISKTKEIVFKRSSLINYNPSL